MAAKTYTEEQIQTYIDRATEEGKYYHVEQLFTRTGVIGGAAKNWKNGADVVYAPGARIYGPRDLVLAKLEEFSIDDQTIYDNVDDVEYLAELKEYNSSRDKKNQRLSSDHIDKILKGVSKKAKEDSPKTELTLPQRLSSLMMGRVINVSDAPAKYHTVAANPSTASSALIGVPGLNIVSKTEEGYAAALEELKLSKGVFDAYLAAWVAVKAARDSRNQDKAPAKSNGVAKKAPVKPNGAAKTTSAAAKKAPVKKTTPVKKVAAK